jgi:hypothetical protein
MQRENEGFYPSPDPGLPGEVRQRVFAAIALQPSPTRQQVRRQSRLLFALTALIMAVLFLAAGGVSFDSRAPAVLLATGVGGAAFTVLALVVALGRPRSMLGRPRAVLLLAAVLLPLGLFAWRVCVRALFEGTTPAASPGWPGLRCLGLGLGIAVVPLLLALLARRGSEAVHPDAAGAAIGSAAGVAAMLLVDLWCPVAHLPHLLLGHLAPIAVIVFLGMRLGSRLLAPT